MKIQFLKSFWSYAREAFSKSKFVAFLKQSKNIKPNGKKLLEIKKTEKTQNCVYCATPIPEGFIWCSRCNCDHWV